MAELRLWHGGAPGRQVGDILKAPVDSGLRYTRREMSVEQGQDKITQRADRVYVTTDRHLALAFASTWTPDGVAHGGGSLYIVESDVLEPDEDLLSLPGLSFQTPSARVIRVAKPRVELDRAQSFRKLNEVYIRNLRAKKAASPQK